jgi:hypothetical protein
MGNDEWGYEAECIEGKEFQVCGENSEFIQAFMRGEERVCFV